MQDSGIIYPGVLSRKFFEQMIERFLPVSSPGGMGKGLRQSRSPFPTSVDSRPQTLNMEPGVPHIYRRDQRFGAVGWGPGEILQLAGDPFTMPFESRLILKVISETRH